MRELRQNASVYLARVKAGESFEVTDRGNPVAMLVPSVGKSGVEKLVAEGRVTPAEESKRTFPRRVRSRIRSDDLLAEQRAERLPR